ncbi:MAG: hypothetical protein K2M89_02715 [Clostridiales bacterium]|nr:hypothetical protein [Clostridiales bacterium]
MENSIIDECLLNNERLGKKVVFSEEYKKKADKAHKLYMQLFDILNDEQKKIFKEYVDTATAVCSEADTAHFKEGLRTGLLLAMECLT